MPEETPAPPNRSHFSSIVPALSHCSPPEAQGALVALVALVATGCDLKQHTWPPHL